MGTTIHIGEKAAAIIIEESGEHKIIIPNSALDESAELVFGSPEFIVTAVGILFGSDPKAKVIRGALFELMAQIDDELIRKGQN